MSAYRASLSAGTRSGGQSASAKHRYQTRQEIYLVGREGVRDDLLASGSGNLPAFASGDAGAFWLAVDSYERKNARLFIELQLNLPSELSLEQQKEAVESYASKLCDEESLPFSWVIHHGKGENPHAHLMINETKNDSIERPAEQHFKRFNSKFPERGGAQKSAALKPTQWLLDARGSWAIAANDALEAAGFERHFDHRTLEEQRTSALLAKNWRKAAELDREVGEHEGWRVAALRRKFESGELPELPEYARKVIESNDRIKELNQQHLRMVDSMTDEQLQQHERDAYFDVLAEREPGRLKAELEHLHSEALELNALHDAHREALAPQPAPEPAATAAEQGHVMGIQKLSDEQQKISEEMSKRDALAERMKKSASKQQEQLERAQQQLEKEFKAAEKNAPLLHKFFNFLREKLGLQKVRTAQQERILQRYEQITKQSESIEKGLQLRLKKECCNDDLKKQHGEKYQQALTLGAVDATYLQQLRASNVELEREYMIDSSSLFDEQREFLQHQQQIAQLVNDKKIVTIEHFEQIVNDTQKLSESARDAGREHQEQQRFEQLAGAFVERVAVERETNKYSMQNAQIAALQTLREVHNATDEEVREIVGLQDYSQDEQEIMIELSERDHESLHEILREDTNSQAQHSQAQQQQQKQQRSMSMGM